MGDDDYEQSRRKIHDRQEHIVRKGGKGDRHPEPEESDDDNRGQRRGGRRGDSTGTPYAGGGGLERDMKHAEETAARHAPSGTDRSLFSSALSSLQSTNVQDLANQEVDEDDAVSKHQQMYSGTTSSTPWSSSGIGTAAAMQAIKMFNSGEGTTTSSSTTSTASGMLSSLTGSGETSTSTGGGLLSSITGSGETSTSTTAGGLLSSLTSSGETSSSSGGGLLSSVMGSSDETSTSTSGGLLSSVMGSSESSSTAGGVVSGLMGSSSSTSSSSQNMFVGMAMAEAGKLYDQQSGAGNVTSDTTKQDVVNAAAQEALKYYVKSEMTSGGGVMGTMASKLM